MEIEILEALRLARKCVGNQLIDIKCDGNTFVSIKEIIDTAMKCQQKVDVFNAGDKIQINNLKSRINNLESKLIETAQELGCMIDMENARIELEITSTDLDCPDYFDHQTVYEAMKLAKET
jgi:hypothetical protein